MPAGKTATSARRR
jgi:hypothetical protein